MAAEKINTPDNPSVPEDASASAVPIQKRINALRENSSESFSKEQNVSDQQTSQDSPSDETTRSFTTQRDEAFLKKFEEELFRRRGIKPEEKLDALTFSEEDALSRRNGGIRQASERPDEPPAPAVSQDKAPKETSAASDEEVPPRDAPAQQGLPPKGAILLLGTGDVAIFHRDVPTKAYQVVLVLNPDGTVSPEGVCLLDDYDFKRIGLIPIEHLEQLLHTLAWNRDHVIFHLDSFDYAHLIVRPRLGIAAPPEARRSTRPAERPPRGSSEEVRQPAVAPFRRAPVREKLERGRRFRIPFGKDRTWEAVYWCEDVQGSVVAHKAKGVWSLLHLDLTRFKDTMELLDKVNETEATEIEKALRHIWA